MLRFIRNAKIGEKWYKPGQPVTDGHFDEETTKELLQSEIVEKIDEPATEKPLQAQTNEGQKPVLDQPEGEVVNGLRYFDTPDGVTATSEMDKPFNQVDQSKAGHGDTREAAFADWQTKQAQ